MEATSSTSVLDYVVGLPWPYGAKQVRKRVRQGGLITAVTESWFPAHDKDYGLILEDDIEVSVHYFTWISMVMAEQVAKPDPRLVGISLYSPRVTESTEPKRQFDTIRLMQELTGESETPYLLQTPCSWGAVYFPTHWREFLAYLQLRQETLDEIDVEVPGSWTNVWYVSWKRYWFELMYFRGTYMLYPNFAGQASLSTNHMEPGQHIKKKGGTSAHKTKDYIVPLLTNSSKLAPIPQMLANPLPVFNLFGSVYLDHQKLVEALDLMSVGSSPPPLRVPTNILPIGSSITAPEYLINVAFTGDRRAAHSRHTFHTRIVSGGGLQIVHVVHARQDSSPKLAKCTVKVVWSSASSKRTATPDPSYALRLSAKGSLQVVKASNVGGESVVWATPEDPLLAGSNTSASAGPGAMYHARLETNGNLVVWRGANAQCGDGEKVWESKSADAQFSPPKRCQKTPADAVCAALPRTISQSGMAHGTFTLIIRARRRYSILMSQLLHYSLSPVVSTIVVLWNDLASTPPQDAVVNGKMIRYVLPDTASPNSMLIPQLIITTDAVLVMDEGVAVHPQDLYNLFFVWQKHKHNVVGFMPWQQQQVEVAPQGRRALRQAQDQGKDYQGDQRDYAADKPGSPRTGPPVSMPGPPDSSPNPPPAPPDPPAPPGYSLMSSKVMMMHQDMLYLYTCGEPVGSSKENRAADVQRVRTDLRRIVDKHGCCEDVGMTYAISAMNHGKPVLMSVQSVHSISDFDGDADVAGADASLRKACMDEMHAVYVAANLSLTPQRSVIEVRKVNASAVAMSKVEFRGWCAGQRGNCPDFDGAGQGIDWSDEPKSFAYSVVAMT